MIADGHFQVSMYVLSSRTIVSRGGVGITFTNPTPRGPSIIIELDISESICPIDLVMTTIHEMAHALVE